MTELNQTEEFVALQTRCQQRVYSFILTLIPNWADAEEVLQETNIVLWRKFDQFQPGTDFVRWANQVAYFEVLKYRKWQKKNVVYFSQEFLDDVAEDTMAMTDYLQAQRDALAECLEKLSEKDRTLIKKRYEQGATTKNVAAALNRSVDSVYKSLSRIRSALLKCVRRAMAAEDHP